MIKNDIFIEVAHKQVQKHGNKICGDMFLSRKIKEERRTIVILSDGLGSGIKANVLASMTASMGLNLTTANASIERTAKIIMKTLPKDKHRKISYSTFTILDINSRRETRLIEFGNPMACLIRGETLIWPSRVSIGVDHQLPSSQQIYYAEFTPQKEDRILLLTDGITQSGIGREDMPFGWGQNNAANYIAQWIAGNSSASAVETADQLVEKAKENDENTPQDDISCGVIYFRQPRKMLVCSGPPYRKTNDKVLASRVNQFNGTKVICGGTTAQIVGRELNRSIEVDMESGSNGLPPSSKMEGVHLISEGILTIGRVAEILEKQHINELEKSPAGKIVEALLHHDEIFFLNGTKVNEAHQDPSLPVELEIRRNVIKKITRLLEENHLKKVHTELI